MAEVEISYKGSAIAQMNASGTKTLLTEGKYLEDDVEVTYTRPAAPSGTKNISITANGVTTEDVTAYASAQITANVPNTYSAGDEGKVVSNGALVAQGSQTITANGTYDTTLISELVANISGGNIGGLANMVDVSSQNYEFGYFFSCLKAGNTTGGTVTYTTAFANTSTKILETGLTTVHGIMFIDPAVSISPNTDPGVSKGVFIFVRSNDNFNATGWAGSAVVKSYNLAQGTKQEATPIQGSLTISGGDLYYAGRYNKNAAYQMLKVNTQYEWLAW